MNESTDLNVIGKQEVESKKLFLKYFTVLVSITFVFLAGILYLFSHLTSRYELQSVILKDTTTLTTVRDVASLILEQHLSDLMVLAEGETLRAYLHKPNLINWTQLSRDFSSFVRRKPQYSQIRLIDLEGMEAVRVNNVGGSQHIVPKSQLQDKSQRYYFKESIALQEGEIYTSPIDLNVENGEIVTPFEPTMRFSTPVYDGYGEKRGIIIINHSSKTLLTKIEQLLSPIIGDVVMLNPEGYRIIGPDKDKLWGFMFGSDDVYGKEYPDVWKTITHYDSGTISNNDGYTLYQKVKLFDYSNVGTPENLNLNSVIMRSKPSEPYWYIVASIDKDLVKQLSASRNIVTVSTYLALFIFSTGLSYFFAKNILDRKLAFLQLEKQANTDSLTGLYNRRELMKSGNKETQRALRFKRELCVMMLDLDHFKSVNDMHGHQIGDDVLKHFSQICLKIIREQDLLARYGGEEFVVIMPETDLPGGVLLAQRICDHVRTQPYRVRDHEIHFTVSIGVTCLQTDDANFEQLIERSDAALYKTKSHGRNSVESLPVINS